MEKRRANVVALALVHLVTIFMWLVVIPYFWHPRVSAAWLPFWKFFSVFFAVVAFLRLRRLVCDSGDTGKKQD